jgi:hypothetical protein
VLNAGEENIRAAYNALPEYAKYVVVGVVVLVVVVVAMVVVVW